jgi:hypothetical protein
VWFAFYLQKIAVLKFNTTYEIRIQILTGCACYSAVGTEGGLDSSGEPSVIRADPSESEGNQSRNARVVSR